MGVRHSRYSWWVPDKSNAIVKIIEIMFTFSSFGVYMDVNNNKLVTI